jgi:hypothetical protein
MCARPRQPPADIRADIDIETAGGDVCAGAITEGRVDATRGVCA